MDTSRVIAYNPDGTFLFEIPRTEQLGRVRRESINGEHSLTITTFATLPKEARLLTVDAMGKWREWVVMGEVASREADGKVAATYRCVWSLQHDLNATFVSEMVGTQSDVTAGTALTELLSWSNLWGVGTVTQSSMGGASMYRMSGWQAMSVLVETWGGEVEAVIEVDHSGVTSRKVNLLDRQGSRVSVRRFDWSRDLVGIERNVDEAQVYCRVIPLGKGEETESGGYGRKIDITSVNDNVAWLEDSESAQLYRIMTPSGEWHYPEAIIENGDIEDPQELKDWALSVMEEYTRPRVTYSAKVTTFAEAGMDPRGVALGDAVHCVDKGFGDDGLRISGRVVAIETDELNPSNVSLTIGHVQNSLSQTLSRVRQLTSAVSAMNGGSLTVQAYLQSLVRRINGEINATGGYTYITEGQGLRTYDKAVSDPTDGDEADKVVEVKGGSIRIADSRDSDGEWDWRTLIVSGHIAAELVTALNAQFGTIGTPEGNFYVDLDAGTIVIRGNATIGDTTVDGMLSDVASNSEEIANVAGDLQTATAALQDGIDDARRYATDYLSYANGELTLGATDSAVRNVLTNTRQVYRTDAGDIAWFGLNGSIWELVIANASISDMLRFGNFAWIARSNGNMSIKWLGA